MFTALLNRVFFNTEDTESTEGNLLLVTAVGVGAARMRGVVERGPDPLDESISWGCSLCPLC